MVTVLRLHSFGKNGTFVKCSSDNKDKKKKAIKWEQRQFYTIYYIFLNERKRTQNQIHKMNVMKIV